MLRLGFLLSVCAMLGMAADEVKPAPEPDNKINPYRLSFGVQVGVNIANATLEPALTSSNRVAFGFGVLMESPLIPGFLYLQPELNFVQKGAQNTHFAGTTSVNLSYLEFPLLAKIKFNLPRIKPYFLAGPSLGYLLGAGNDGTVMLTRNNFSNFDLALAFGGGVSVSLGEALDSPGIFFGVRYSYSLNNIDSAPAPATWHSSGFQLNLGAQF